MNVETSSRLLGKFLDACYPFQFLGDAVIDFLVTCHLLNLGKKLDPGQLTDMRSALVNNNTLVSMIDHALGDNRRHI